MATGPDTHPEGISGKAGGARPREELSRTAPAQAPLDGTSLDTFNIGTVVGTGTEAAADAVHDAAAERIEASDLVPPANGRDEDTPNQAEGEADSEHSGANVSDGFREPRAQREGGGEGEEGGAFDFGHQFASDRARGQFATEFDPASAVGDGGGDGEGSRGTDGANPPGSPDGTQGHRTPVSAFDPVAMAEGVENTGKGSRNSGTEAEFAGLFERIGEFTATPDHPSPTVSETELDGDPVDDPVIDGEPVVDSTGNSGMATPPTAPGLDVHGHGMVVYGGGAAGVDAADIPGLVAGAAARIISGPVGQVAGAFGTGWRAGRAIDESTGIGEKAVEAAIGQTEAGRYAAEQELKAAEAQRRREEDEAKKATEEKKDEEDDEEEDDEEEEEEEEDEEEEEEEEEEDEEEDEETDASAGVGQSLPDDETAQRGAGFLRDYAFEQIGRNPGGTEVNPGTGDTETISGNPMGEYFATHGRLSFIGQPGGIEEGGGSRGPGSLQGSTLPGALGNIDYGPDHTGEWSDSQLTDTSAEDALNAVGGSPFSVSDARRDDEEEEEEDDTSLSTI